jgi:hypothetical protein
MSKLKIVHNLDGMTKEQIDQYLRDISEHLGIDPDLNAFDVIRMDNRLQVYARRGTTDMLRESMDIDVTSIDLLDIPGSATFRATGRKGHAASNLSRQEIAIGSCAIAGLTGQKLSDAIMTAETRAGRRLTLKFTGLGILDVSEVPAAGISAASGAELAGSPVVMPPPTVRPAEAPGRDITAKVNADVAAVLLQPTSQPSAAGVAAFLTGPNGTAPTDPPTEAEMEEFRTRQAELRADAQAALVAGLPKLSPNPPKEGVSVQSVVSTTAETAPATEAPRRRRRARNTVDISSPGQPAPAVAQAVATTVAPAQAPTLGTPSVPAIQIVPPPAHPEMVHHNAVPAAVPQPAATDLLSTVAGNTPGVAAAIPQTMPTSAGTGLTEEQKKTYFDRWKEYTQNVLPKAGMMGMDGVGGSTMQMRKFVQVNNGVNVNQLDAAGWDDLLSFLDNYSKQNGAPALVAYIQKAITTA